MANTTIKGNISFADKIEFFTSGESYSVKIGDLDGDGKPDLVTANFSTSTVSVFRNNSTVGTIRLDIKNDYLTEGDPFYCAIGDIDLDGKPDLIVTNSSSSTVSVFRNTSVMGSISFATKVNFTTGSTPAFVTIGDLDGDGKPDIAIANFGSTTVSVLKNLSSNGTISFAPKVNYDVGASPNEITIGDLDGDGKPYIAVIHST